MGSADNGADDGASADGASEPAFLHNWELIVDLVKKFVPIRGKTAILCEYLFLR